MSPLEHFQRAEALLSEAADETTSYLKAAQLTAMAGVHAQLAQIGTPLSWQGKRP